MRFHTRAPSRSPLAFLALALAACGAPTSAPSSTPPASASSTPASEPGTPASSSTAPSPSAQPAPLEVHEWGVVDVVPGGVSEVGAGPGAPDVVTSVRKPVVYFHLDPGASPLDVHVEAAIPGGALLEVVPPALGFPERARWDAHVAPCSATAPLGVPVARTACSAPDGYCEAFDLPTYETADASCVTTSDGEHRLLFYRGALPAASLPLVRQDAPTGARSLRAEQPASPDASVFYVVGGRGITLPWPAPGTSQTLPDAFSESLDGPALARALDAELQRAGLTASEAAAFLRAWSDTWFGAGSAGGVAAGASEPSRRGSIRDLSAPRPFVLYVMPETTVPRVAELTITPPPRVVRRVMVVRLALD